jgi:protein O-mannosyl-transferase
MTRPHRPALPRIPAAGLLLAFTAIVAAALYWPGLSGPFMLDDLDNLAPIFQWHDAGADWREVVFANTSGLLGRPISMASLLLNAAVGGVAPFSFKLGNLLVHLACGLLVWRLLSRALSEDEQLRAGASFTAAVLASLWLLHPLHASTVLYAVQRMAQMGALFVLASVWAFMAGRDALQNGRTTAGHVMLFVCFPLLLLAGLFSKEGAAIAPGLCLVMELAYFSGVQRRPTAVRAFFAIFFVVPVAILLALLVLKPEILFGQYALWDFTLGERLLTQSRVVVDYLGQLVFPRGFRMGLYHDDFSVSTSLLSPLATIWSMLALAAISVIVVLIRKRAPSIFAGWFFFLVAHLLESSFLPMDLYFEHRNYLPSVGLLLCVAGLWSLVSRHLPVPSAAKHRIAALSALGIAAVFGFATLGRALIWQDKAAILEQALHSHPDSLRANIDQAAFLLRQGRLQDARLIFEKLGHSQNGRNRLVGNTYALVVDCLRGTARPSQLTSIVANAQPKIYYNDLVAFELLARVSTRNQCATLDTSLTAGKMAEVLDAASAQPDSTKPKWMLRVVVAQMYAKTAEWNKAEGQAERAWQASKDPSTGALLAVIYSHKHRFADASTVLEQAARQLHSHNVSGRAEIDRVRDYLKNQQKRSLSTAKEQTRASLR